jgi:sphingomyelin phosphodiesterase
MKFSSALYALAVAGSLSQAAVVEKKDLASDIWADIESAADCAACEVRKQGFFIVSL